MDLFGAKFCITMGAWRLRFVLMIEDESDVAGGSMAQATPHHVHVRRGVRK